MPIYKTMERPKRQVEGTKLGRKIIDAFEAEKAAHERGEIRTVRTVDVPDEPGAYTADDVRKLRERFGVSQAIFAYLVGTSTVLVSKWEQGQNVPTRMARRLMDAMKSNPEIWQAMLNARTTGARSEAR